MEQRVGRLNAFMDDSDWDEDDKGWTQRFVPRKSPFVRRIPYGFHFDDDKEF